MIHKGLLEWLNGIFKVTLDDPWSEFLSPEEISSCGPECSTETTMPLFGARQGKSLQSGTRRIGRSCIPTCTHIFVLEVCQQVPVYTGCVESPYQRFCGIQHSSVLFLVALWSVRLVGGDGAQTCAGRWILADDHFTIFYGWSLLRIGNIVLYRFSIFVMFLWQLPSCFEPWMAHLDHVSGQESRSKKQGLQIFWSL